MANIHVSMEMFLNFAFTFKMCVPKIVLTCRTALLVVVQLLLFSNFQLYVVIGMTDSLFAELF